jgi:hypothetical protein
MYITLICKIKGEFLPAVFNWAPRHEGVLGVVEVYEGVSKIFGTGARIANGTAVCHYVQLYSYCVSKSSEFCRHNPLCGFSTGVYCCKRIFRYRLSPETFGYTLVAPRIRDLDTRWRQMLSFTPQLLYRREGAPVMHWIGGWMGPRFGLDKVVKRKIPTPDGTPIPPRLFIQPVAHRYTTGLSWLPLLYPFSSYMPSCRGAWSQHIYLYITHW